MKIALIIITILVIILICIYGYYGGLKKIDLEVQSKGGETIVYKNVTGAYNQASNYVGKIHSFLIRNFNIETTKGIGIFYDNPKNVDKEKLRSDVGCILDNPEDSTNVIISEKFQVITLPKGDYIVTEFPMKGNLSILIGVMRVYPALSKYCQEHGYKDSPVTEIYDFPNKKITFRKEIIKTN
jgi:DNA gyrase inhibitor